MRKRSDNVIPDYDYLFREDEDRRGRKKNRFLSNIMKINLWAVILSSFVYILQSAPLYVVPLATSDIINAVTAAIANGEATYATWRAIGVDSAIMLFVIMMNIPTTIWRWHIVSKTLRRTSAGLKGTVVRKLQSLSITYHKDMETGEIQSKFLKDTDSVDNLFNCILQNIIPNLISAVISAVIAFYKNGFVALFFICVIPINVFLTVIFRKKIRLSNRDYRIKTENMSNRLTNMLVMTPVTKSHGLEETEIRNVKESIRQLEGSGRNVDRTIARFGAWTWVVNTLLNALCLVFCACLALKKYITVGDVVLYQSMFSSLSAYVTALVNVMPQIGAGAEALESVSEIMNAKDVEYNIGKKKIGDIEGRVRFDDVSYKYPDGEQFVVKDFSLDVKAGECVAFVGSSGSGKSTIMNLIIGFMMPTLGKLYIDDKPTDELDLSEYRHHISVVPQNSILFSGTIRENITYGMETYSEEDLQKAIKDADVDEFLSELPDGIDTMIGENGGKLSGGQKQRITIARALIRNPRILILDEATSALDNLSEKHVQNAISKSVRGRTTFIVAHRLSTIRNADRIVVMEDGVCVECGTYDELMAKKGKFYELKKLS